MPRHATRACAAVATFAAGLLAWPTFGADWPNLLATGGDQTFVTNVGTKAYGVHIFSNTASTWTFTPNSGVTNQVQYLVVAGGGGGGAKWGNAAGGGGGGAWNGSAGGRGGNGIVVIRYEIVPQGTVFYFR
jgi:hypothetical protein